MYLYTHSNAWFYRVQNNISTIKKIEHDTQTQKMFQNDGETT